MQMTDFLSSSFLSYHSPLYWRNIVEIIFFSSLFYYAARWLKKDRTKNLVLALYGYATITFAAHFMGLTTISYVMFLFVPVVAMVFILLHQEFLQKNLVTFKNITPATKTNHDWLETLIRIFLTRINTHQELTCIIEQKDSLSDLVHAQLPINAHLEQELLDLIITSPNFHADEMMIVTAQGKVVGVNTRLALHGYHNNIDATIKELPQWKQEALFLTSKTDALVFHINATSRTFDVIINGMIIDRMHAAKALELLKKYMVSSGSQSYKGGITRENNAQKRVPEQHQS